jgi:hypothetical protein
MTYLYALARGLVNFVKPPDSDIVKLRGGNAPAKKVCRFRRFSAHYELETERFG